MKLHTWVYSSSGYQKKEKRPWDFFRVTFYKLHFHETNVNVKNIMVGNKIIHVMVVIFHMHT
jgi:hypothetical protein